MNDAPRYATLQDYLRVVRERKLIIVGVALLAAVVAVVLSSRQTTKYEAKARIALNDTTQDAAALGSTSTTTRPSDRLPLYASRVTSVAVLDKAANTLGPSWDPGRVRRSVRAQIEASTGFITVIGSGEKADDAARVATTVATETVRLIVADSRKVLAKAAREVQAELKQIPKERRDSFVFATTQQRLLALKAAARLSQPVGLNERATVPGSPVSPKPVRDGILGLVFGLILGLFLAFLRDTIDVRLRHPEDAGRELDLPVVGRVRDEVMGRFVPGDEGPELHGPAWEAFSILRTNLGFLAADEEHKVVLVTSALPEEGKSTVAMHLAAASALAGRRTLLVDVDLRRPVLAARTHIERTPGLTDYLMEKAAPTDVLRTVSMTDSGSEATTRHLTCIPAGTETPRVPELLASDRFTAFISEVREEYDLVILDSPPLLAVADPLQIVPVSDVVLLCVKLASTRRTQAKAAREALSRAPQRPTGLVVTGVKASAEGDYGQYGYAYYTRSVNGSGEPEKSGLLRR